MNISCSDFCHSNRIKWGIHTFGPSQLYSHQAIKPDYIRSENHNLHWSLYWHIYKSGWSALLHTSSTHDNIHSVLFINNFGFVFTSISTFLTCPQSGFFYFISQIISFYRTLTLSPAYFHFYARCQIFRLCSHTKRAIQQTHKKYRDKLIKARKAAVRICSKSESALLYIALYSSSQHAYITSSQAHTCCCEFFLANHPGRVVMWYMRCRYIELLLNLNKSTHMI